MPDRFGQNPGWARSALFYLSVVAYVLLILIGLRALTWPAGELHVAELVIGRTMGGVTVAVSAVCLLSYPMHRWRWEMHGTWALVISMVCITGVIVSTDPYSAGGLLSMAFILIVIGIMIRAIQVLLFAHQTTTAARRRRRRRQGTVPVLP